MEVSETQNAEYLPALRSHFGMFGVVCEVTLRIFEAKPLLFNFQVEDLKPFLDNFKQEMQTLRATYDQAFGMLFTNNGKLLLQCRKFVEPGTPSPHPLTGAIESRAIDLFSDLVVPIAKAGSALRLPGLHAELLNHALIEVPLKLLRHSTYITNPCNRAIIYDENAPTFEFYDWVFPEEDWPDMVRAFLQLCQHFEREHNFVLTLPALVYFIKQDQASLLSRSRKSNMIAVDPEHPDPNDPTWKKFRLAFSEVAMLHGGIPHINKTRDGAIYNFAKACDQDTLHKYLQMRKRLDPKDLFLNDFFTTMFAKQLSAEKTDDKKSTIASKL
jgi:L-gulonolactone oxidase